MVRGACSAASSPAACHGRGAPLVYGSAVSTAPVISPSALASTRAAPHASRAAAAVSGGRSGSSSSSARRARERRSRARPSGRSPASSISTRCSPGRLRSRRSCGLAGGRRRAAAARDPASGCGTLGLARGLRGVEQTPETSFVLPAVLRAYPQAVAVHVVRDGRDVVTSLLERGWLSAGRDGGRRRSSRLRPACPVLGRARARGRVPLRRRRDPLRLGLASLRDRGPRPFRSARSSCATRISSPIRRRSPFRSRSGSACRRADVADVLGRVHDRSAGRWRRDLTEEQVADVEREAGGGRPLGYERVTPGGV